ncbi:protein apnoia [Condylostylus longicornis]|uniref:protein apnoia n=1 Tax=Condylostylus longicornis TaxID=2530218 RepID=UPI00244DAAA1|nr:protein apnoia [Condylostylus longicornis]
MAAGQKIVFTVIVLLCIFGSSYCEEETIDNDTNVAEGRTFGHHFLKRISFAIVPAAFVVGVITTLLAALTVVSMKGLGVGVILLILTIGQMLARSLPFGHIFAAPAAAHVHAAAPLAHVHAAAPVWFENKW